MRRRAIRSSWLEAPLAPLLLLAVACAGDLVLRAPQQRALRGAGALAAVAPLAVKLLPATGAATAEDPVGEREAGMGVRSASIYLTEDAGAVLWRLVAGELRAAGHRVVDAQPDVAVGIRVLEFSVRGPRAVAGLGRDRERTPRSPRCEDVGRRGLHGVRLHRRAKRPQLPLAGNSPQREDPGRVSRRSRAARFGARGPGRGACPPCGQEPDREPTSGRRAGRWRPWAGGRRKIGPGGSGMKIDWRAVLRDALGVLLLGFLPGSSSAGSRVIRTGASGPLRRSS